MCRNPYSLIGLIIFICALLSHTHIPWPVARFSLLVNFLQLLPRRRIERSKLRSWKLCAIVGSLPQYTRKEPQKQPQNSSCEFIPTSELGIFKPGLRVILTYAYSCIELSFSLSLDNLQFIWGLPDSKWNSLIWLNLWWTIDEEELLKQTYIRAHLMNERWWLYRIHLKSLS